MHLKMIISDNNKDNDNDNYCLLKISIKNEVGNKEDKKDTSRPIRGLKMKFITNIKISKKVFLKSKELSIHLYCVVIERNLMAK